MFYSLGLFFYGKDMLNNSNIKACIVGMGYVGLPLFRINKIF